MLPRVCILISWSLRSGVYHTDINWLALIVYADFITPLHHIYRLVKSNGSFDGGLVPHRLQTLLPLLDLEHLVDDSVDLHLACIKIRNSSWEFVGLGETAQNRDFIAN